MCKELNEAHNAWTDRKIRTKAFAHPNFVCKTNFILVIFKTAKIGKKRRWKVEACQKNELKTGIRRFISIHLALTCII